MKLEELEERVLALEGVLAELAKWTGFEIAGQKPGAGRRGRGRPKRIEAKAENSAHDAAVAVGPNVERPNLEERAAIDEEERGQGPATKDVVFNFIDDNEIEEEESDRGSGSGGFEIMPDSEDYELDSDEDDEDEECDPLSDETWAKPIRRRKKKFGRQLKNEDGTNNANENSGQADEDTEGPRPCAECGESLPSAVELRKHRRRVHNDKKPLERVCEFCQKIFTHKQHYITHLRMHTGEKPFLCSVCAFSTRTNSMLTKHMLAMHPESPREKNVKCDQCNKLFLTKSGLRKHVAVEHSDEWKKNRAQCSICYVVFRDVHKLKRHIEDIHEDKRSFACELCGQLFKRMSHLKSHIRRHDNPKRRRRGQQKPKIRGTPVPPIAEGEPKMFESFDAGGTQAQHDQIEIGAPPNPCEVTQEVFFITEEPAKVVEVDMSEAAFHMEFLQ